jgi:flagellar hook-basal body complex protein FliE
MKLGEITNSLSGINKNLNSNLSVSDLGNGLNGNNQQFDNDKNSFSNMLKNSVEEVNETQVKAYDAMNDIATGKVENLQEAVQKIEEAEISLKLGLEVKNKALGAYKQIMSMQI